MSNNNRETIDLLYSRTTRSWCELQIDDALQHLVSIRLQYNVRLLPVADHRMPPFCLPLLQLLQPRAQAMALHASF